MKKKILSVTLFVLVIWQAAFLTACRKDAEKFESVSGVWSIHTYAEDGVETDVENAEYNRLTTSVDGSCVLWDFENSGKTSRGTYEPKGDRADAKFGKTKATLTFSADRRMVTVEYRSNDKQILAVYTIEYRN